METDIISSLLLKAISARDNSYSQYSGFRVGAAVLCESGSIYTGCNIENASYGLTVCAERTAIFKAVSEGERYISALAVVGSGDTIAQPCGACLQVIAEFCRDNQKLDIIVGRTLTEYVVRKLSDYLPYAFELHRNTL